MDSEVKQPNLCIKCSKGKVVNQFYKLCKFCNKKRLDETKSKFRKPVSRTSRSKKASTQKQTIKEAMLRQSGGLCSGCGNQNSFLTLSHTIPISLRKDLELEPGNLMLECMACHTVWEHGSVDQKKKLLNYEFKIDYIIKTDPHYYERKFNH